MISSTEALAQGAATIDGRDHNVTFDVSGELIADDEAALARMMAHQ